MVEMSFISIRKQGVIYSSKCFTCLLYSITDKRCIGLYKEEHGECLIKTRNSLPFPRT